MRGMVTGDQYRPFDGTAEGAERELEQIEEDRQPERVRCSCRWATSDSGSIFFSKRVEPDPNCPAHRD